MLILILASLARARGATLIVDGTSGYLSISEALADAADGDTIEISAGTWYDCIDLDGKSLSIIGTAGSAATTLDAGGTCDAALVSTTGAPVVVIEGLTVSNHESTGVRVGAGTFTLDDVALVDAGSAGLSVFALEVDGGGVTLMNSSVTGGIVLEASGGTLEVVDCALDDAAISTDGADVAVRGTTFENLAPVESMLDVTDGSLDVQDCIFSDIGGSNGSALHAESAVVTISGSAFLRNGGSASMLGGAVMVESAALDITSSEFSDNATNGATGEGRGGAVYSDGDVTVSDSTFTGNLASKK